MEASQGLLCSAGTCLLLRAAGVLRPRPVVVYPAPSYYEPAPVYYPPPGLTINIPLR
jgi:hypothetical protein